MLHVFLVLVACRDPVLRELDGIAVPRIATAGVPSELPRIGATVDGLLLDPGASPDEAPRRIPWTPTRGYAIVPLLDALEAWRRRGVTDVALVVDTRLPYRDVVRVLFTIGTAGLGDVELVARTADGPGAVVSYAARYCSAQQAPAPTVVEPPTPEPTVDLPPDPAELLRLLGGGDDGPCVLPAVTQRPDGLEVVLRELEGGSHCATFLSVADAVPDGWRGAVVIPAAAACPSASDAASLEGLLARSAPLGPPCASGSLAPAEDTPWGEALGLLVAIRTRHPDAGLALSSRSGPADCSRAFVLP